MIPALIPLRDGQPLNTPHHSAFRCNCSLSQMMTNPPKILEKVECIQKSTTNNTNNHHFHEPYIPLVNTLNASTPQIIGRFEFFLSTWTACSCITFNPDIEIHHPIATCIRCQESTKTWARDYISKRFLQVELLSFCSETNDWVWKLLPISKNVPLFLRIDGHKVDDDTESSYYKLQMGSILSLVNSNFTKPNIDELFNKATLHFRVGWVSSLQEDDHGLNHPRPLLPAATATTTSSGDELYPQQALDSSSSHVEEGVTASSSELALDKEPMTIFLLGLGSSMTTTRVRSLMQNFQNKVKNSLVLSSFSNAKNLVPSSSSKVKSQTNKPPNIIVVDRTLNVDQVSKALGFDKTEEFQSYLQENRIQVVSPEWMIKCEVLHDIPRAYLVEFGWPKPSSNARLIKSTGWITAKRKESLLEIGEPPSVKASDCFNPIIQGELKRRKEEGIQKVTGLQTAQHSTTAAISSSTEIIKYSKNLELSDLLDRISKIYSECPLQDSDIWRGYTYKKAAGCLRYLDFEVSKDPYVIQKLQKTRGIGDKVLEHVIEYLSSNRCSLIQQLENDPTRGAVKNLMGIWGVGPTKAFHLAKLGCKDINDVRNKFKLKKNRENLNLSRHISIGIECYDDLLEKMDRSEVQSIADIVEATVVRMFPEATVLVMGSYRREKEKCGDVDILITHPNYVETTPLGAIDWVVESLKSRGHISHHLTSVDTDMYLRYECLHNRNDESYDECFTHYHRSAMYMGVFSSPIPPNKMRRIDIKFYPLKERITAMLYFTGSDYFNRSMRLIAKKKHFHLDDHGLFQVLPNGVKGEKIHANTEKDIFDTLGLEYKEPKERISWESIQEKGAELPSFPENEDDLG